MVDSTRFLQVKLESVEIVPLVDSPPSLPQHRLLTAGIRMKQNCKHCGLRFRSIQAGDAFCCEGCRQVHEVIKAGGLEGFYMRQDRAGQPIGTRHQAPVDREKLQSLLIETEQSERAEIVLKVKGMSCLGCVWLIEQIANRFPGVFAAKVGLQSNLLSLRWKPGEFNLCELAEALQRFGYEIDAAGRDGLVLSPLARRLALITLFSLNGILLTFALGLIAAGSGLQSLLQLIILVCLFFTLILGGDLYFRPAWQGLQVGRFHSDLLPAVCIAFGFGFALASHVQGDLGLVVQPLFFMFILTLTSARWLVDRMALRIINE